VRVLLDEHLPVDLVPELQGHDVDTVVGRGWAGVKNSELLRRVRDQYNAFITMDRAIEFQQNIPALPFGVILACRICARSCRRSSTPSQRQSRGSFNGSVPNVPVVEAVTS